MLACVEVDACVEEGKTRSLRSLAWLAPLAIFFKNSWKVLACVEVVCVCVCVCAEISVTR